MVKKEQSKAGQAKQEKDKRTTHVLLGAASRLQRLAKKRGTVKVRSAYINASKMIRQIAKR